MGLPDVDEEELHLVGEIIMELGEPTGFPTKGPSGVAPEDQRDRALADEGAEGDGRVGVELREGEVGRAGAGPVAHEPQDLPRPRPRAAPVPPYLHWFPGYRRGIHGVRSFRRISLLAAGKIRGPPSP